MILPSSACTSCLNETDNGSSRIFLSLISDCCVIGLLYTMACILHFGIFWYDMSKDTLQHLCYSQESVADSKREQLSCSE